MIFTAFGVFLGAIGVLFSLFATVEWLSNGCEDIGYCFQDVWRFFAASLLSGMFAALMALASYHFKFLPHMGG